MTLVTLPSLLAYPGSKDGLQASTSTTTLNAGGNYIASIIRVPKTGNISAFGWFPSTVSGSGKVELRAETVGTDGLPTGTLWGTNTNLAAIAPTSNTWRWDTLTAVAAVTRGDVIAFKLLYESGTSVAVRRWSNALYGFQGAPYGAINGALAVPFIGAVQYDDASIPFTGMLPISSNTLTVTIAQSGTPDEAGLKFTVPMACTIAGFGLAVGTAARTFDAVLYDGSNNVLASLSVDTDVAQNATAPGAFLFATPVTLTAGATYRLVIKATSGASTITVTKFLVDASGTRAALPGGTDFLWTERTDAGAWTDTTTAVPQIDLLLSQIDDGAGGGGLLVNPGMSGGFA